MNYCDIIQKWTLRALSLASEMKYDPTLPVETAGILKTLFGEQWLSQSTGTKYPAVPLPYRQHSIGSALHIAGEYQIIEMLKTIK